MEDIIQRHITESNNIKKSLMIAYLNCYSEQKELYTSLIKEGSASIKFLTDKFIL